MAAHALRPPISATLLQSVVNVPAAPKETPEPAAPLLPLPEVSPPSSAEQSSPPVDSPPASSSSLPYRKSSEVDEPAEPIDIAPLIYPDDPYLRKIAGKVTLRIFINEIGTVDSIDVLSAVPSGLFEVAAIDSILDTRFRPARLFGKAVPNVKVVEINFDPYRDAPAPPTDH